MSAGRYGPVLIVKCTRICNLRCEYCTDYRVEESESIDIEKLAAMLHGIAEDPSISDAHFIWHGGEPLTKGRQFFEKLVFLQDKFLRGRKKVTNSVQTNGTLVTREWAQTLRELNFSAGLSLDGPKAVQDKKRPYSNPQRLRVIEEGERRSTHDAAMRGLALLHESAVSTGVLTVVSPDVLAIGAEAMYRFYRSQGLTNIALLWMRGKFATPTESLAYNRAYGEFMAQILRLWLAEDDPTVQVRELGSKLNRMFGLPQSLCKDGGPCVGKFFGVEPEGGVWHCDKFVGDERFYVGNLLAQPVGDLARSTRIREIAELEVTTRNACAPCKWFDRCRGGCLSDLLIMLRDQGQVGTDDCWHFRIYEELAKVLASSPSVLEAFRSTTGSCDALT